MLYQSFFIEMRSRNYIYNQVGLQDINHRQYTYKHLTILCFCVCDSYIRLVLLLYIYVSLYLEAAVGTVFEIATFPLAKILNSRSIKNVFFQFLKKKISKKKNLKKKQK